MSSRDGGATAAGLKLYGALPPVVRQRFVRAVKPSFTVGTMAVVTRTDGYLLLVRHSYMSDWSFPGGLLNRREMPEVGVARETREEVGIRIVLAGEPAVVVDPYLQVVRLVFRAGLAEGVLPDEAHAASPEIVSAEWVAAHAVSARLGHVALDAYDALLRLERRVR